METSGSTSNDLSPFAFFSLTAYQTYIMFMTVTSLKLLFGIGLVIMGKRALHMLTFTFGSLLFLINTFIVYGGVQGETNVARIVILIVVCLAASLGGALIFSSSFVPLITFLFGAYAAALLGLSLLSIGPNIPSLAAFLWTFSFAYIGGILILSWQDIFLAIGTSFMGSLMIADSIDNLANLKSKFSEIIIGESYYVLSFDPNLDMPTYEKSKIFWILFGSSMGLAAFGAVLQLCLTAKSQGLLDLFKACTSRGRDFGHETPIYEIEVQEALNDNNEEIIYQVRNSEEEFVQRTKKDYAYY